MLLRRASNILPRYNNKHNKKKGITVQDIFTEISKENYRHPKGADNFLLSYFYKKLDF